MKDFRHLEVWRKAHQLTLSIYELTGSFPSDERFGLVSQLRRSCSSIPANIAEGCGRTTDAELSRFCAIAMGSASELEYHLLLARDLRLLNPADHEIYAQRTTEVKRMLAALIKRLCENNRGLSRPKAVSRTLKAEV